MHVSDGCLCNIYMKRDTEPEAADTEKGRLQKLQRRIAAKPQTTLVEEPDEDELEWLIDSTDATGSRYLVVFTKGDCHL